MKFRFIYLPVLLSMLFMLILCKKNHYKAKVSSFKADIEINRLEKDLFGMNPEEVPLKIDELRNKYDGFLQLFSNIINTGEIDDPSFVDFLTRFCTDRQNNEVYGLTIKMYPDVDAIEKGLEDAFRHYLY